MRKVVVTGVDLETQQSKIESIRSVESETTVGHDFSAFYYLTNPDILAKNEAPPENFDLPIGAVRCFESVIHPTKNTYDHIVDDQVMPLKEYFQHSTNTIDFAIVTKGVVTMIVNDEEVELHPGDVIIQRGARHAWHNYTNEKASIFFVMVGAKTPSNFQSEPAFFPDLKKSSS